MVDLATRVWIQLTPQILESPHLADDLVHRGLNKGPKGYLAQPLAATKQRLRWMLETISDPHFYPIRPLCSRYSLHLDEIKS